ncbi:protein-disulfide reductase DsbD family protein [Marinimicrobium alkaliphilum]|uniref:protein-disulfide reductase DsbD family protein n=1 Tax=Marinimicrobium alkaliphilum TaxID=2202654 RepID=UPI000DB93400|nr:protein-disulfide reductase DsbD domain-containing protein [Marinimicrobium alkaliphilum]
MNNRFFQLLIRTLLIPVLWFSYSANALVQDDFLPVTEAFELDAHWTGEQVILRWDIAPEYYLYRDRTRVSAAPAQPVELQFSEAQMIYDPYFEEDMAVFRDSATVILPVDAHGPFALEVVSQGCAEAGLCYPPHRDYLKVDPRSAGVTPISADQFRELQGPGAVTDSERPSLWLLQALVFALLGGVILNAMPCVFPVLSIKVMSLVQSEPERLAKHGWAYTLGIMASFIALAAVLMLARAGGQALGWGFQLQSPLLVAALAYLFLLLGLGLSGMINIGTGLMGAGQSLTEGSGLRGSFFTGVLAAVVASPCTAPFMGAALGFALTQPGAVSLGVFAALGLGMALPLLLLCHLPQLAKHLPRPGPWMETLKELLAFPLYLTAIWLLWVLGRQVGLNAVIAVASGGLMIIFALWLRQQAARGAVNLVRRGAMAAAWVVALMLPWQIVDGKRDADRWESYSAERLASLRAAGKPVFINLTADWCITCLANERVALGTNSANTLFDELGVVTLKGDWTNRDPEITALLERYGRSGVPLYLWYPAGHRGPGQLLPQLLTPATLADTLRPNEQVVSH